MLRDSVEQAQRAAAEAAEREKESKRLLDDSRQEFADNFAAAKAEREAVAAALGAREVALALAEQRRAAAEQRQHECSEQIAAQRLGADDKASKLFTTMERNAALQKVSLFDLPLQRGLLSCESPPGPGPDSLPTQCQCQCNDIVHKLLCSSL